MYKALVTDIDGTLTKVRSDGIETTIQELEIIKDAIAAGVVFGVATGRGWGSTKPVVDRFGIQTPCIIEGGARIVDPLDGSTVWETSVSVEKSNEILRLLKRSFTDKEFIKSTSNSNRIHISAFTEFTNTNRIIYVLGASRQDAENAKVNLLKIGGVDCNITTPSWRDPELYDVHITSFRGNKRYALKKWLEISGLKKDQLVVVGDSDNDIPLFEEAEFRVATANSTENLKEIADYVSEFTETAAVSDVLNKYFVK